MSTMIAGVALREAAPADVPLLRELFAADRPPVLLDQQYDARAASYAAAWPMRLDRIIEVDDQAVGRVLVGVGAGERRIVDVAVLPAHRDRGIGTGTLQVVLAEADEAAEPVTLRVDHGSPARHLYERLGFSIVAEEAIQHVMRREISPMRRECQ